MPVSFQRFSMQDANVALYKSLFPPQQSSQFFSKLYQTINWKHEPIRLFGKSILQPRLTAYFGDKSYTYSGITMNPLPWFSDLLEIKSAIEPLAEVKFNAVLIKLYRDGNDYIGWHSDDERDLIKLCRSCRSYHRHSLESVIGSVSFGATRRFIYRRKDNHKIKVELSLADGDLLIMRGEIQRFWQHQVPRISSKMADQIRPRMNLTFRVII